MRSIIILSVIVCAYAYTNSDTTSVYSSGKSFNYVEDKKFVSLQTVIFDLLKFPHMKEHNIGKYYSDIETFKFSSYKPYFTNYEYVYEEFVRLYNADMFLKYDAVFSILNEQHRQQAILLFKMFYYTTDWTQFYNLMVWARYNMNPHMFVYSLQTAVYHRKDMVGIVFPRIYEIFPNYFFGTDIIQRAQHAKMNLYGTTMTTEPIIIESNFTYPYQYQYTFNDEQRLSYFTEDVDLNARYYNYHIDYPFWMGGEEFGLNKDRRGEYFVYFHQQLLARYYLERLSNDMGPIKELSFYTPLKTGYNSNLRYYNGYFFATRDNNYNVYNAYNYYYIELLQDYERRLRDAVVNGFFMLHDGVTIDLTKPESIEFLGNYLQGNQDCKFTRFYSYMSMFAKMMMMGYGANKYDINKFVPSVFSHYETQLRDPVFYQLYKRVMRPIFGFQKYLPTYKYMDYYYAGVRIESVNVDKLYTFFDKFEADITNAVDVPYTQVADHVDTLVMKYRYYRLNHDGFTVTLNVEADKVEKSLVKIFIGPKYNEFGEVYGYDNNRENFFELDSFVTDLKVGKNVITRHSDEFYWFGYSVSTYFDLYKMVMLNTKGIRYTTDFSSRSKFPYRLMLPKGKESGLPVQFYFIVTKYVTPKISQFTGFDKTVSIGVGSGAQYVDGYPFGFPFNRRIDESMWNTPNMYYYDTFIYHKSYYGLDSYSSYPTYYPKGFPVGVKTPVSQYSMYINKNTPVPAMDMELSYEQPMYRRPLTTPVHY